MLGREIGRAELRLSSRLQKKGGDLGSSTSPCVELAPGLVPARSWLPACDPLRVGQVMRTKQDPCWLGWLGGRGRRRRALVQRRHFGLAGAHQAPLGPQLPLGLQKVTAVGPQQSAVGRHQRGAGRAGEARDKGAAVVVRVHVLG
eukprot:scaffold2041_cov110-Isochrysis_galbana.AAC.1